jgi:hypothetical protein
VGNAYRIVQVLGGAINTTTGTLYDPSREGGRMFQSFNDSRFGGAVITYASFNGGTSNTLIFDELGSPAADTTGDTPGLGGTVRISGPDELFDIVIEPFTGRVTTRRMPRAESEATAIEGGS